MNSEIPWEREGMGEIGTVPIFLVQGGPVIGPPPQPVIEAPPEPVIAPRGTQ